MDSSAIILPKERALSKFPFSFAGTSGQLKILFPLILAQRKPPPAQIYQNFDCFIRHIEPFLFLLLYYCSISAKLNLVYLL